MVNNDTANTTPNSSIRTATLIVAATKQDISSCLEQELLRLNADVQHVALSGGSLPALLQPCMHQFSQWHVYLADERCVASTHPDSNLGALQAKCLQHISSDRIHGINEALLHDPVACAQHYERVLQQNLPTNKGLDLALLGFGEDGHTCSLFPEHDLVTKPPDQRVAAILDSPKPPPQRITLTMMALAETQHVIFVGAGSSKAPVLDEVFANVQWENEINTTSSSKARRGIVRIRNDTSLPCASVSPQQSVTWIVDAEAYPKAFAS